MMTEKQIHAKLEAQIRKTSLRKVAALIGISPSYLSRFMRGESTAGTMIPRYLGIERQVSYRASK